MIPIPALSPKTWLTIIGVVGLVAVCLGVWGYIGHLEGKAHKAEIALVNQQRADALAAAEAARLALASKELFINQLEHERAMADADAAARQKVSDDELEKLRAAQQAGQGSPLSPSVLQYLDGLRR